MAREAADEIERLRTVNFALAAGQCIVDGGLLGDEGGTQFCSLQRDAKRYQWLAANCGLVTGPGWWALKTHGSKPPDCPLGLDDAIDEAMREDKR
jgi:hypothetical protein